MTSNPYWDVVQTFPNDELRWNKSRFQPDAHPWLSEAVREMRTGKSSFGDLLDIDMDKRVDRDILVQEYAYAIPSPDTLTWVVQQTNGRPFVEIGAGNGYWAWMLGQYGVEVTAFDRTLVQTGKNGFFRRRTKSWFPVLPGGPEAASRHADKVLFLCWPPYAEKLAIDALTAYRGDTLLYIGEGEGGCCGDDEFFSALADGWVQVDTFRDHIQWSAIHDTVTLYRRNYLISET